MKKKSNIQRYKEELQYLQNITSDETGKIKALEAELNESEEHIQMNNLEKKWNNQQQTNQVIIFFHLSSFSNTFVINLLSDS